MAGRIRKPKPLTEELIGLKPHPQQNSSLRKINLGTAKRLRGEPISLGKTRFADL